MLVKWANSWKVPQVNLVAERHPWWGRKTGVRVLDLALAPLFFVGGHVPPLLRSCEELLLRYYPVASASELSSPLWSSAGGSGSRPSARGLSVCGLGTSRSPLCQTTPYG
jgi:hypothetical protein